MAAPLKGNPIGNWPSLRSAVMALLAENLKTGEIVDRLERLGAKRSSVYAYVSMCKDRPAPKVQPDLRGIWTPEKLAKARRLIGKTMIYIAQELQVPADELLLYGLKGIIPPMGKTQRIAALLADMSEGVVSDAVEPEPVLTPDVDERSRDEEELVALDEAGPVEFIDMDIVEVEPARIVAGSFERLAQFVERRPESLAEEIALKAAGAGPRVVPAPPSVAGAADPVAVPMAAHARSYFTLRNEAGEYLHEDGRRMTCVERFRGRFTEAELRKLRRQKPALRQLIEERA